jgi:hypothetical protein
MMSFRFPYLALDIETTGLDRDKAHVLQLAAIYDNGGAIGRLPTFNRVVLWPSITYGTPYALNLNARLFAVKDAKPIDQVREEFMSFIDAVKGQSRLFVAGKNVGSFDVPILTNPVNGFDFGKRIFHRFLDPGSMFTEYFQHIPTQDEINKLIGRGSVSHDALDDAWDVVHAVRYAWKV